MPSSPSFTDFQRQNYAFFYRGISLTRPDALADGKVAFATNVRSRQEGEVTVRDGLRRLTTGALAGAVNRLARLNDPARLAGGAAAQRFAGTDAGNLYAAEPNDVAATGYALVDAGYSGDPVSCVPAAPFGSPEPWLYVSDVNRMRKFDAALTRRSIGLPPPAAPPTAALAANETTFLQSINVGTWVAYGGTAGAVATGTRLNTTVNAVIYDQGATGMGSFALADMTAVTEGATVDLGGSAETVIVQEVITALSATTIEAILYDQGANGWCTIQPAGSFALGQTEQSSVEEIRRRYHDLDDPHGQQGVTITRAVDYPVNGLVMLNAVELVRIVSVAVGPDGVMSFRAFCAGTYAAGNSIVGVACFRAYSHTTIGGGSACVSPDATNTITPVDADTAAYAGIQTAIALGRDWAQVGARATQADDLITLSVHIDQLAYVQFVRLLLATNDAAAAGEEFSQNYYQYEWRANDLLSAVQSAVASADATGTSSMLDAQQEAVVSGQSESLYQDSYGTSLLPGGFVGDTLVVGGANNTPVGFGERDDAGQPPRTDGFVTAGTAPSRQLALGNSQWITLHCRVRDLLRVGTDPSRTLRNLNSAAIVLQVLGTAAPVTVSYSDVYLTGGYGPDCGLTRPPYVYRSRYRSTLTGERSNPSPSMRAGLPARRQRISLTIAGCREDQCDVIDIFRFGGGLARWTYVRSAPNDTTGADVHVDDDMADRQVDGGEGLKVDQFQPWPVSDLPRQGTCRVVGTSVERLSGDAFNTSWAPDTVLIVNGRATSLYGSPATPDRLQVIDNCDASVNCAWSIPSPTIMAVPLSVLWGGAVGDQKVWFHFACGDPYDPGAVHWTHGNDPDASSDTNTIAVSTGTEPLMNGVVFDQVAYVFSTERLYRLEPAFGTAATFIPRETSCTRGLWNRWALTVADEGIYFVAQDGIFLTTGGAEVSIVDPDLRRLFPRDGSTPDDDDSLGCLEAIDFTGPMQLRKVDQILYFEYRTVGQNYRTLLYEPLYQRWTADRYDLAGARTRIEEPGRQVHDNVIGCQNGHLYQLQSDHLVDDGTAGVQWSISTAWANGKDPRALKQWGDMVFDVDTAASCDGLRVEPVVDYGTVGLAATSIGSLVDGRQTFIVEVGGAVLSRTLGALVSGVIQTSDLGRPRLYFWEPSWLGKQTPIARRFTDWEDLGYKGAKFVQGIVIRANTFGQLKTIGVQYDGGTQALQLEVLHSGERQIAYPRDEDGWAPFQAELVRLVGLDDVEWTLLDWRWIFEPAPELATQWETQDTTFDFTGYGSITDGVLAYQSAIATTLRIWHGAVYRDYAIPASGNIYRKVFIRFGAAKGTSFRFRWTGTQPFRIYQRDCSVRATPWGGGQGYTIQTPFGGPSRVVGAEV